MTDAANLHSRSALEARFGAHYRWYVLLTVMIGSMASIMASTIINVAVPDMSRVFTLGQERAQWLSAGFMAAMTLSMLTTPFLLERFGYRHTYVGAVLLLMAGGIAGGLSNGFDLVPSVGGVLVEWYGWRSNFFVVVPFCAVAAVLAQRFLPVAGPGGAVVGPGAARLDKTGLAWVTVAVLALLNGMVSLHGGTPMLGAALLASSAVAVTVFIRHQRRSEKPLMALALFGHDTFSMGAVVAFIYGMGLFVSTYLVPVLMQVALHLPPSQAGAVLFPAGVVLAVTIPLSGRLVDRVPVSRIVACGLVLLAASFFAMMSVNLGTALLLITLWAVLGRIGLGMILPSLNLGAMRGLPDGLIFHGSSSINFMRQLGGAVGVSLVGIVLEWRLQAQPTAPLRAFHETFALIGAITALAVVAALRMKPAAPAVPAFSAPDS